MVEQEGAIYWCDDCDEFIRYDKVCANCNSKGSVVGWMKTNEEV
jgi:RNA polymerase subunit RPABC4/transcription elongation factor Spt4